MKILSEIEEIDSTTIEGKMLITAIAILSSNSNDNKPSAEVISEINIQIQKIKWE